MAVGGVLKLWFADGTNYPGQDDIRARQDRLAEALATVYKRLGDGQRMVLEYKLFEPSFYTTDMPDWGTALTHCVALGSKALVLVDTGHHAPGTNIEFIVASLLRMGKLGAFDFNSRFYADDDLMVGAADPFQLFRIMHEVVKADALRPEAGVAFMLDQCHNIEPKIPGQIRSVMNVQEATATADACRLTVVAGPVEATAFGKRDGAGACARDCRRRPRCPSRGHQSKPATRTLRASSVAHAREAVGVAMTRTEPEGAPTSSRDVVSAPASQHPGVRRRLPRLSEIQPYLRTGPIRVNPTDRRLASAATIGDLRSVARRHTPRAVFDYVDGAAETETSLRRSREAFARVEFVPSVLQDVSEVDTSTTILGLPSALPFVFAPTGFTRLMNHEGEPAVARVAGRLGIPYALSTLGTTSPEDVAAAAPDTEKWFQLYLWNDRDAGIDLVRRARAAGFSALVLTVDTPVAGARLRDVHNGFTIPPTLSVRTLFDIALHPGWWFNLLTTEPLRFAAFSETQGTVADLINRVFDPTITVADLGWLRDAWTGPIVIKGIQTIDDARRVVDAGADAIVVSNHGGRQLDRAPTPLEQLPGIVAAVGDRTEVYVDGGILGGADVVAAIAMGARAALVGRAYLYGLMAGGERGVQRAGELLRTELVRTMKLMGVRRVSDLTADRIRVRDR